MVHDSNQQNETVESLAASVFLRKVVPVACLRYLRIVELVFGPYYYNEDPSRDRAALQDWADTVDWAKDKLNAPSLTVRVIITYMEEREQSSRRVWTEEHLQLADQRRIVSPLARVGLDNFYAQFAFCKWGGEKSGCSDRVENWEKNLKEKLEKLVLGHKYNSPYLSRGQEPSRCISHLWQEQFASVEG